MRFLFLILAALLLSGCSNATQKENDPRQAQYNAFVQQARKDVARDPALNCDPEYQDLVVDQIDGATNAVKALIRLAMGDACIEAGGYSDAAQYSQYHDDAP